MNQTHNPFDQMAEKYDRWYDENHWVFQSEVLAIERLLPHRVKAVEIGVGTGRFAGSFNIRLGVDPSPDMLSLARNRNINVIQGVAESLPFRDESFGLVLMVAAISFLTDIRRALSEAYRILWPGGHLIIGFIDKLSELGKKYKHDETGNNLVRFATFYSPEELTGLLEESSFEDIFYVQTLFHLPEEVRQIEPVKNGYGLGSFLVVRAVKY
jgi:ubiquinone/menaquinone biosynthesis C-methylase UbiE